jgi:hypothetical protein
MVSSYRISCAAVCNRHKRPWAQSHTLPKRSYRPATHRSRHRNHPRPHGLRFGYSNPAIATRVEQLRVKRAGRRCFPQLVEQSRHSDALASWLASQLLRARSKNAGAVVAYGLVEG